ncbi:hypothetical protein D3C72_2014410 [compost metagenome]
MPSVKYWLAIAFSTGWPNPCTPIIEAMTTMASAIMIVWLMPAMIVGSAKGICTFLSFCQPEEPNASAASSTSLSTRRMPRLVSLIIGGMA